MLVHDKQTPRQFLLDMKSGPTNLIHSASKQHARFSHQSSPFQHQSYAQLNTHMLSHHHMPTAIEQLELYSAYAYQQQQQLQQQQQQQQQLQTHLIGSQSNTECRTKHQLAASEVLDLSRRDSVETTATSTTRKTPSPYQTTSSFGGESPAVSPRENNQPQQQQRQHLSPNYDAADLSARSPTSESQQQPNLMHSNLLYTAQAQFSRLAPPLASFYPALYNSFGHLTNESSATINGTFNATSTPPTTMVAPRNSALTPPASVTPTQAQTSPIANSAQLSVANAVAAAAAAAAAAASAAAVTSTASTNILQNVKTEDCEMTPLSPSSSLDGRSRSPCRQNTSTKNNPTTPSSSNNNNGNSSLNALKTTRPFKAFPRDPLVIAANFAATDVLLDNPRVERYTEYRKRVLEQIRSCNGGSRTITNPKMRRMNTSRRNSNTSSNAPDYCGSSEGDEERHLAGGDSSDCDSSYAGGCGGSQMDKVSSSAHHAEDNNNNQLKRNKTSLSSNNNDQTNSYGRQVKDAAYYERRRKNNAAAKKSRDRRRIKEDEIAIRAAYLERQNIELLCQIDALKAQLAAFTSKVVSA